MGIQKQNLQAVHLVLTNDFVIINANENDRTTNHSILDCSR